MSKAILVMDMPDSCSQCPCCYVPRCEVFEKTLKTSEIYECKPEWCPLQELPQKKEATQRPISPLLPKQYTAFEKGYNACIDEIMKGSAIDG